MSPIEFSVRMTAADAHFAQALKKDDIREMRAALAEKTALLKVYFGTSPHRAQTASARRDGHAAKA
jgi:hypothetical protein